MMNSLSVPVSRRADEPSSLKGTTYTITPLMSPLTAANDTIFDKSDFSKLEKGEPVSFWPNDIPEGKLCTCLIPLADDSGEGSSFSCEQSHYLMFQQFRGDNKNYKKYRSYRNGTGFTNEGGSILSYVEEE
ncbi:hypothetical protein HBH64_073600 [Parastagonospora nodorum]|nr:hypothetical protein HBH50_043170 [Parastagonospora nodorum]KAH4091664.1 hypothetical protein HBH48_095490 [Parastagonospora nodorum]KAH4121552.1 hypothetical protein HBH47_101260 [Parastagonospora nodorum]KAH4303241.1 hypothetical protein HBI01_084130 [Parastagonospora nodorum]KAH4372800.1 hypothetical protein HBH94_109900 [Parastagonospora nodorum]